MSESVAEAGPFARVVHSESVAEAGPFARVVLQQCLSASLQLNFQEPLEGSEETDGVFATIGKGLVIYVCFLKGASASTVDKLVKVILATKLSEGEDRRRVGVTDLPGDVIIVPQATLGGRLKGKSMQYHHNIGKSDGLALYNQFVASIQSEAAKSDFWRDSGSKVRFGTYGNRQVLSLETNGPYTHVVEI